MESKVFMVQNPLWQISSYRFLGLIWPREKCKTTGTLTGSKEIYAWLSAYSKKRTKK
jgi:hypothetical protein